jgi:hypothetical protein
MPQFFDRLCRCPEQPYTRFDNLVSTELALKVSAGLIVNESSFCTMIHRYSMSALDGLELKDLVGGLRGSMGVYHIWRDDDFCDIHQLHNLECVYVGKGKAHTRMLDHMTDSLAEEAARRDPDAMAALEKRRAEDRKKKKERFLWDEAYWITFFECENRVAKYLEQLFLDTYHFPVNSNENPGKGELWASWEGCRYSMGTEAHAISNLPNAPSGI